MLYIAGAIGRETGSLDDGRRHRSLWISGTWENLSRAPVSLAATAVGRHGGFVAGSMTDVCEIHFGSVSSIIKLLQVAIYTKSTEL